MRDRRCAWVRHWLILCAALVPLHGCVLSFKAPTVRVAEVRLTSLTFTGGALAVTLEVENPNRFALESEDFRYALAFSEGTGPDVRWITLAEGQVPEPVKISGQDKGTVTVDVPFDMASVGVALGRLLRSGELEYRFTGEIRAHTPLGSRRIPIDQRGLFRR